MRISLEPRVLSGNDIAPRGSAFQGLSGQTLFSDISFDIKRGERVALIETTERKGTTHTRIINLSLIGADAVNFPLVQGADQLLRSGTSCSAYGQDNFPGDLITYQTLTEIRDQYACRISLYRNDVFKEISALRWRRAVFPLQS